MSENPLDAIWGAFVDRGWDGSRKECYACGRDAYGTHDKGCVIGKAIPALRAVEQLEQAARELIEGARERLDQPMDNIVSSADIDDLRAALVLFDRKEQT